MSLQKFITQDLTRVVSK